MLNKIILIGNLGKDAEVKATPSGKAVCRASLATKESWKDSNGERQSRTTWHDLTLWGPQAEVFGKYGTKGKLVYAEGVLRKREYEDKNGVKKLAVEVEVHVFQFLSKNEDRPATTSSEDPQEPQGAPAAEGYDDDIPF